LARTSEQSLRRKNKMPYFFTVLVALSATQRDDERCGGRRGERSGANMHESPIDLESA
jgi:hypothetical protein